MKVFLKNSVLEKIWEWNESAYIECIPRGNEVGFIALTGHQTYASFSAHLYSTGREMFCVQLFQVFVSRYIMILLFYDTLNLSDKK